MIVGIRLQLPQDAGDAWRSPRTTSRSSRRVGSSCRRSVRGTGRGIVRKPFRTAIAARISRLVLIHSRRPPSDGTASTGRLPRSSLIYRAGTLGWFCAGAPAGTRCGLPPLRSCEPCGGVIGVFRRPREGDLGPGRSRVDRSLQESSAMLGITGSGSHRGQSPLLGRKGSQSQRPLWAAIGAGR